MAKLELGQTAEKEARKSFQWVEDRMRDIPFAAPHYARQLRDFAKNLAVAIPLSIVWVGWFIATEPINYVKDLRKYGYRKTSVVIGSSAVAFPAYVAFDSHSKGESLEMTAFRTACAWGLESIFGATPLHTSLLTEQFRRKNQNPT